ncbi:sulfatase [Microbacterium sp. KKR3/1]|uniref:sulfatase n=1 Tax=Microbacterium sp. KKR3/1 TaxID=2904241 RepID=UPI001E41B4CF|nr:sulfatase [Microbacterium sp. KKR3/1]MCE0510525.1 sulfatase [Microbacterium sp. KKR3/1]
MKAIMVMYDTLNRKLLPPYGADQVVAPNFSRLTERTATFDNCYAGSMPCVPARREMHTGRYNFLHRSWGPLEPFDDSVPEMLRGAGVYTHLVTDNRHYWGDGGATYHGRFSTFEFFRGQEGDAWKGQVADPDIPDNVVNRSDKVWRQDWVNRTHLQDEADHPQTLTFDAGMEFLRTNVDADDWYLQIEAFDPHEPFFSYEQYRRLYDSGYEGPNFDWPAYRRVIEDDAEVEQLRNEYMALVTMCDNSLGRVLDFMDENDMWDDTMLIVCTDHGLLLGEHNWWGKNVQPWFDENIHIPLFVWDPRSGVAGERRAALVQTIDLGPTLLEFFGIPATPDMQGRALAQTVRSDEPVRSAGLFGNAGGHVNVTDGRYVYMRACADESNSPLFDYTLMPTHMGGRFAPSELAQAELHPGFSFTKGAPVLKVPGFAFGSPWSYGTLLFDLQEDPQQDHPLRDEALELRMATMLVEQMRASDAPPEQFERLGLPAHGEVTAEHLLVEAQWEQVQRGLAAAPTVAVLGEHSVVATATIGELFADDAVKATVLDVLPFLDNPYMAHMAGAMTLLEVAAMKVEVDAESLIALDARLGALSSPIAVAGA